MVTREKSKEALAVASTVTHFTEIVVARGTARYIASRDRPWDPFVCAREIHSVSESSSVYTCTCIQNVNACARVAAREVRCAARSKVLSSSSQLARLNLDIPWRDRLLLCDIATIRGKECKIKRLAFASSRSTASGRILLRAVKPRPVDPPRGPTNRKTPLREDTRARDRAE